MRWKVLIAGGLFLSILTFLAWAQKGPRPDLSQTPQPVLKIEHAKPDTIWFEFKQTGNKLMADLLLFNDQPIAGGQIPLKFGNGKSPLAVDSVVFDKKRAGKFDMTNDGAKDPVNRANQTLRIGFLADISGRKPPLEVGKGKLLTIYFSLKTDKAYEVEVDTTTLAGGYSFLFADQAAQNIPAVFKKGKFKTK